MAQHSPFHEQLRYERERRGWSQADLAKKAHCDTKTVGRWESGERLPRSYHRQFLYELFGKDAEAFGVPGLTPASSSGTASLPVNGAEPVTEGVPDSVRLEDWHEAPAPKHLHGREQESARLECWLQDQGCRVIAVTGMGGVGKSALVSAAATGVKQDFDCIFWRSLENVQPAVLVVKQCLGLLTRQSPAGVPEEGDDLLPLLLSYLRDRRCLLVLDHVESVMQAGERAGGYREGYAAYGRLIRLLAETQHQSCLVLISREKPKEVAFLEGAATPLRTLSLPGIGKAAGQELLKERGLYGSRGDWAELIERYSGNPLALQQVSEPVREVFGGSIAHFLREDVSAFGEVNDLLEQHFHRLSEEEREIVYSLALERAVVPLEQLRERLARSIPIATLLDLLDSLRRRAMIETSRPAHFTLHRIFMEYVTAVYSPAASASGGFQRAARAENGAMRELVTLEN